MLFPSPPSPPSPSQFLLSSTLLGRRNADLKEWMTRDGSGPWGAFPPPLFLFSPMALILSRTRSMRQWRKSDREGPPSLPLLPLKLFFSYRPIAITGQLNDKDCRGDTIPLPPLFFSHSPSFSSPPTPGCGLKRQRKLHLFRWMKAMAAPRPLLSLFHPFSFFQRIH